MYFSNNHAIGVSRAIKNVSKLMFLNVIFYLLSAVYIIMTINNHIATFTGTEMRHGRIVLMQSIQVSVLLLL